MKERRDCKIVQDLLPNYIEKLTSEETNQYIEEHLKECRDCNTILDGMKKELEVEPPKREKEEINYIKKFSKKMKNLKLALAIILIVLVVVIGRKVIILNNLEGKSQETKSKCNSSYYAKTKSYSNGTVQLIEAYVAEEDYLVTITRFSENLEKSVHTYYKLGDEKLHLIENADRKIIAKTGEASINPVTFTSEFFVENLYTAIFSSVEKVNINGRKCYRIRDRNTEKFIDSETGIAVKAIDNENNRTVEYDYEFGKISRKDIVKPDLSGYIKEK